MPPNKGYARVLCKILYDDTLLAEIRFSLIIEPSSGNNIKKQVQEALSTVLIGSGWQVIE